MEPLTIWEIFERSRKFFGNKTAVIFLNADNRVSDYSYNALFYETEILARGFQESKIEKADRVCLYLANSPEFIVSYLALSKIGAVPVLINPSLPKNRADKIFSDVSAKILVDKNEFSDLKLRAHASNALNGVSAAADIGRDETVAILYSSGTTGEQKGVELTKNNIYCNIRYTGALTGMTAEDRIICFLPLTHCFGLNFVMGACFYTGATLALHEKFDLQQILNSLIKNKVTMFFAVPAVYNMLLKQHTDPFYFSSVRYFFYAADSMSPDLLALWADEYGKKIYTGWGLTETSPFATSNHEAIYKLGSVGKPIPGVEIKILKTGKDKYGEICVRGHNVMKRYWNQPEETARVIDNEGWFHTGDIGYRDKKGYLFVVDRLKDMINVGGEKAWPAEIEKIMLRFSEIMEVGVVGIPHQAMGEVPKAFVVARNPQLTADDIHLFLKKDGQLMKHEFPREIEFIQKLPRNPSGKILRKELRGK